MPRRTRQVSFHLALDLPEDRRLLAAYDALPTGTRQEWLRRLLVMGFLLSEGGASVIEGRSDKPVGPGDDEGGGRRQRQVRRRRPRFFR